MLYLRRIYCDTVTSTGKKRRVSTLEEEEYPNFYYKNARISIDDEEIAFDSIPGMTNGQEQKKEKPATDYRLPIDCNRTGRVSRLK